MNMPSLGVRKDTVSVSSMSKFPIPTPDLGYPGGRSLPTRYTDRSLDWGPVRQVFRALAESGPCGDWLTGEREKKRLFREGVLADREGWWRKHRGDPYGASGSAGGGMSEERKKAMEEKRVAKEKEERKQKRAAEKVAERKKREAARGGADED